MNIFENVKIYAGWTEVNSREFSEAEISAVKSASVTRGDYGLSVCFVFVAGGKGYIPLSPESKLVEGEVVDLKNLRAVELSKPGEKNIIRLIEK